MAYKMTARRRAALKKAQAASARKRRKGGAKRKGGARRTKRTWSQLNKRGKVARVYAATQYVGAGMGLASGRLNGRQFSQAVAYGAAADLYSRRGKSAVKKPKKRRR